VEDSLIDRLDRAAVQLDVLEKALQELGGVWVDVAMPRPMPQPPPPVMGACFRYPPEAEQIVAISVDGLRQIAHDAREAVLAARDALGKK
jgi:hypothetical protein